MTTPYQKHSSSSTVDGTFDYTTMLSELKERFSRHIRFLGVKNTKGCKRYDFEVDFCHALNDLEQGPIYLRGKLFERPNNVINRLVSHIKALEPQAQKVQVA
jgi:hypothetical protein